MATGNSIYDEVGSVPYAYKALERKQKKSLEEPYP
jgi:hypothetical protein